MEYKHLKETKENLTQELNLSRRKYMHSEEKVLQVESELMNAMAEVNVSFCLMLLWKFS